MIIIVFFVLFLLCGMISAKIKICLNDVDINNSKESDGIIKKFDGRLILYLFGIIKIISLKFDKTILTKYTFEDFVNNKTNEKIVKAFNIKDIKLINLKLEKLDFVSNIGTEDVIITSIIIFVLSSILTYAVSRNIKNNSVQNYKYKLNPIYANKNIFIFKLNCIISMNVAHIIYMLFKMIKRSVGKNGRTSNRKLNDYSYE